MLQTIENSVLVIRDTLVILDSNVATFYGVETRELAQAVKNNPDKFPAGYILELSKQEKDEVIKNFDNPKVKFSPSNPKAFTEKGDDARIEFCAAQTQTHGKARSKAEAEKMTTLPSLPQQRPLHHPYRLRCIDRQITLRTCPLIVKIQEVSK